MNIFQKIKNWLKNPVNIFFLSILVFGFFLRIYKINEFFGYDHDHDLASWFVKDIVVNKHLRLIGQETSTHGVFIGPIYYYLLVPFYLFTHMDPIGGVYLTIFLGLFGIFSFYYVISGIFSKKAGLVAALLYSFSFYTIFNDKAAVPTTPVIIWTVWYLYALNQILTGKQKTAFIIFGILIGLIWNLNMALILLLPLIPLAVILSKKKVELRPLFFGTLALIIVSLPLILFEFRHNFSQINGIFSSLTTDQKDVISGTYKLKRVFEISDKNSANLIWGSLMNISYDITTIFIFASAILLTVKKIISKNLALLFLFWWLLYIVFFSTYSKVVSEYYLNGLIVITVAVFSGLFGYLLESIRLRYVAITLILLFTVFNIDRFLNAKTNGNGYVERKAIVSEIKSDSLKMGYPCVAISYITDPGYNLGYRYLFYLQNMHVNQPSSGSPVYTIVFPLKTIFPTGKTFGATGLIYPDYKRYTKDGVQLSCSGDNANLTDPMFGFTN